MADGQTLFQSDSEWATRAQYWLSLASKSQPKRNRRERQIAPLILTGHGLSIRVDKSCLLIRDGNTHYPADRSEWRFFKGSLDVPQRIILIDGSGNISLDALDWISEQHISLVRISHDGANAIVLSQSGFAADPKRVAWQRETRDDPKLQLAHAIDLTRNKFEAALETLQYWIPESANRDAAILATEAALTNLQRRKAKSLPELLGIEGPTAKAYWRAWQGIEMRWKAQSRYPIPDSWRAYTSRISQNDKKWRNRNATHPINAMLNYAYAVLMADMRIKAIADGYDPMLGILHDQRDKGKDRTPSFALDLMEPLRPVVDRAVLRLISEEVFSGADFQLQSDGVCRLNPDLARQVAIYAGAVTRNCFGQQVGAVGVVAYE
jgi:CRISPR-associated protein Cas1